MQDRKREGKLDNASGEHACTQEAKVRECGTLPSPAPLGAPPPGAAGRTGLLCADAVWCSDLLLVLHARNDWAALPVLAFVRHDHVLTGADAQRI